MNSTQGEWVGMGQGSEVYRWEALLVERGLVLGFLSAPSGLSQPPRVSHNHPHPGLSQPAPPTVSHSPPWSLTVPRVSHSLLGCVTAPPGCLTIPPVSHSPPWSFTAPRGVSQPPRCLSQSSLVSHSPRVSHSPLTCSGLKSVSCCESPPGSLLPHVLLLSHGGGDHWLPRVSPALSLE